MGATTISTQTYRIYDDGGLTIECEAVMTVDSDHSDDVNPNNDTDPVLTLTAMTEAFKAIKPKPEPPSTDER